MKIYALLDYEILIRKEWLIEIIKYRAKKGDKQRKIKNLQKIKSLCNGLGLGTYIATSTKDDTDVLKESLSGLVRLSFKLICAIGGVKVDDEIDGVACTVAGSDLYEY